MCLSGIGLQVAASLKRALGVTYRPLKESMTDFFQQMIDSGAFEKRSFTTTGR